jgi:hypothetical protein
MDHDVIEPALAERFGIEAGEVKLISMLRSLPLRFDGRLISPKPLKFLARNMDRKTRVPLGQHDTAIQRRHNEHLLSIAVQCASSVSAADFVEEVRKVQCDDIVGRRGRMKITRQIENKPSNVDQKAARSERNQQFNVEFSPPATGRPLVFWARGSTSNRIVEFWPDSGDQCISQARVPPTFLSSSRRMQIFVSADTAYSPASLGCGLLAHSALSASAHWFWLRLAGLLSDFSQGSDLS